MCTLIGGIPLKEYPSGVLYRRGGGILGRSGRNVGEMSPVPQTLLLGGRLGNLGESS